MIVLSCLIVAISKLDDLEQALDNPYMKIYGPGGSYLEQIVSSSNSIVYQRLWERLNQYSDSLVYDELDLELYLRYLQSENVGFIVTRKEANELLYLANQQEDMLYIVEENILTYYSRMVMNKAFPCPDLFNSHVKKLNEMGMYSMTFYKCTLDIPR